MTDLALGFPARYIQGPGALDRIGQVATNLGQKALVLADPFVIDLVGDRVVGSLKAVGLDYRLEAFGGECCAPEIERLTRLAQGSEAQMIVAIGGGKALDTGKAVAAAAQVRMISVPTIASTDGPVSSIAVEYTEDHVHIGVMRFNQSPDIVLVDSDIIAKAPAALLIAGMGDGIATWYEARACHASGTINFRGGAISPVALALARQCLETILEFGEAAVADVAEGAVAPAVERVIEANIFLSGIGFENTGVAGAHALDTAISRLSAKNTAQHGERVALGVLFQLALEGSEDEIGPLLDFYGRVELPRSFAEIGLDLTGEGDLDELVRLILRDGSPIYNLPFDVDHGSVSQALDRWRRPADQFGNAGG
ncbi:glycerol dehydrogenase [Pelagibius litoralis]|uniref:Glycerol dehydrogenase n=1 Tax=Pelagibius litoralis TaxID=374515 RepID=A0A967K9X6_9PROT|nr:glycerol dehydrogenase [Pelagibius litoralis]NIA71308.1 glycerol dehydrogenase [Pelagibius litoralis]